MQELQTFAHIIELSGSPNPTAVSAKRYVQSKEEAASLHVDEEDDELRKEPSRTKKEVDPMKESALGGWF